MSLPGLYLDEDIQSAALIEALRARWLSVVTTTEAERVNASDEEQLAFATSSNRVLVTCNVADFASLHSEWIRTGREHAGIVLVQQQKWGPGELARRIIRLLNVVPAHDRRNRLEFVSHR